jgi:hypothetical protein
MTDEEDRADELYHFAYSVFYKENLDKVHQKAKEAAIKMAELLRDEHFFTNDNTVYGRHSLRMQKFYDDVIKQIEEL